MKTPPRQAPAEFHSKSSELWRLQNAVQVAKSNGQLEQAKSFMRGHSVRLTNESIGVVRHFLQWKKARAEEKGRWTAEFSAREKEDISRAYEWLIRGMHPEFAPGQARKVAESYCKRTFKISQSEIEAFLNEFYRYNRNPREQNQLFGRLAMFLDSVEERNQKKPSRGNMAKYGGLSYGGQRVVMSAIGKNSSHFNDIPVHELAHQQFKLNERLAYAAGLFYSYSTGGISSGRIVEIAGWKNQANADLVEGAKIVAEALRQKNASKAEEWFWGQIRKNNKKTGRIGYKKN